MAAKMTRAQVALLLGVTPKTLYLWEKSGRVLPPERDWRGWRWYTESQVEALRRIVGLPEGQANTADGAAKEPESAPRSEPPAVRNSSLPALDISARNRLIGTVTEISGDGALVEVVLDIGGNEIVSVITRSSVERLGIRVGAQCVALIKATEVMLAREV